MEFAVISPTSGLERYGKLTKSHLVLAPVYLRDPTYAKFYNERSQEGDFILLDNGAYEGEPEFHTYIMQELQPSVVVLPDYLLQNWKKTWHAAMAALDRWDHDDLGFEWLYIPQAEKGDMHGFISSYLEAAQDPRISWLGIPRSLALSVSDNPLARVEFARLVRTQHPHLKLHAFGMCNGDVHELPYLAQAGVNSVDSSAPVWRGWNTNQLGKKEDHETWDRVGTPVEFDALYDTVFDRMIKSNLEACGVNTNPGK